MIKVDDFLFPFKIYLYILIGVIFILPTIIAVFFDLNNADVFNFELTSEDMNLITNMETCGFSGYYIDENME